MSEDASRIVSAYVLVQARKSPTFREDSRRAGEEAGREFERGFDRESDKGVTARAGKRAAQGRKIGAQVGDPAGTEAGKRTSERITESLAKTRTARQRDGETLGGALGDALGKTAGRRAAVALSRSGLRQEIRAEAKYVAAMVKAQSRDAALAQRASERAAAAAEKAAARAAAKAKAEFDKSVSYFRKRADSAGAAISSALRKGFIGVGVLGGGAAGLSSLGTLVSGTVAAVTELSGAVGVLPGAFAVAGVAAGTLKLGLTGIGDALKNSGDPKKYAEALKQLSPDARGFVKAIVGLKPELKEIKSQVQQGLFKGAGKEVEALGKRYLPSVKAGLGAVAKEFGDGRRQVANYFDSISSQSKVKGILDDTARSSAHLSDALKPAASALLNIASTGAKLLPGLAGNLEDVAHRFEKFTTRTRNNGSMGEFFAGGIAAAKDFARAVGNAGRILGGIFKAGGSGQSSVLSTLAALLGKVADQIARPEFQQGLGNFFAAIRKAGATNDHRAPRAQPRATSGRPRRLTGRSPQVMDDLRASLKRG